MLRNFGKIILVCVALTSHVYSAPGYTEADAYAHNHGHVGVRATAGVARTTGERAGGVLRGEATALEVGARAEVGADGVGMGFRATAGEVGGQIGGALGIGGKLGLSADTEIGVGKDGASLKIIGTGWTLSSSKGFEICVFGSCLNFG